MNLSKLDEVTNVLGGSDGSQAVQGKAKGRPSLPRVGGPVRPVYSRQTANEIAAENLAKPSIKAMVDRALAHRANRVQVKQDEVVLELKRIALADPALAFGPDGSLLDLSEMPEDIRRAISSFDVEQRTTEDGQTRTVRRIRFWSKTDALDKLARHLGILVDRQEVEHGGGVKVEIVFNHQEAKNGDDRQSGPARDALVDGASQLDALSRPAESLALCPLATNGRAWR